MDTLTAIEPGASPSEQAIAPPPTALIEVLDAHNRIHSRHRLASPGNTCTIGRSVACDIVLDDPFAAADHTRLTLLDDGCISVTDLGSRNGTRVDGQLVHADRPVTITDGELIIGRTRVRIRTALTTLIPERVFRRDILQRHRSILAAIGLALCVAFVTFQRWIEFPDPLAPEIFTSVVASLAVIFVWVGLWGVVTRYIHGAWTMRAHLAIAANAIGLCAWLDWLVGVAIFATEWQWLAVLNVLMIGGAVLGALYLHLRKATHISIRTAAITAAVLPLTLVAAALWVSEQNSARDINRVSLGPTIYPPRLHVVASAELGDYMSDVAALKREANRKRRQSLADRPLAESR